MLMFADGWSRSLQRRIAFQRGRTSFTTLAWPHRLFPYSSSAFRERIYRQRFTAKAAARKNSPTMYVISRVRGLHS